MTRIFIKSHTAGSRGALSLARAIGAKVIKHVNSNYKPRASDIVIPWGSSSNKLENFRTFTLAQVSTPEWTTYRNGQAIGTAEKWIEEGSTVVCRTILNGSCGKGIVIAKTLEELVDAPLYVKYIPKKEEYRVHVAFGKVIAVQRKARRLECENPNWQIRNHENGFVFVHMEFVGNRGALTDLATAATEALKLSIGAVDIIWNEKNNQYYVLEVNTSPGLEGKTIDAYVKAIKEEYNL